MVESVDTVGAGPSGETAKAHPMQGQEVSLGCGTLILIAIIVMIFSGSGTSHVDHELTELRTLVMELKKSVDVQTAEIQKLRERIAIPAKAGEGKANN